MAPESSRSAKPAKRKSQSSNPPLTPSHAKQRRQSSISNLFSSQSDQQSSSQSRNGDNLSPQSKRRKLRPSAAPESPQTMATSTDNMYKFGKTQGMNGNGVVDLTLSPPSGSSPRPRAVSGAAAKLDHNVGPKHPGAKKLVVRNLKTSPRSDPSHYCRETIAKLDAALTAIFNGHRPALSNEELYRGAENICKLNRAEDLAKNLLERCKDHVNADFYNPIAQGTGRCNVDTLRKVTEAWETWKQQLNTIRSIFFYLDRSYLLQTSSPSIYESAITNFRFSIFGDKALSSKAIDGACDILLGDRNNLSPDTSLFRLAVDMFHQLGVYTHDFEPKLMHYSQTYICEWSDRAVAEKDLPEYVTGCVKLIEDEMKRCDLYNLDNTTRRDLLALLEHHLVERREVDLTDQVGISGLLDTNAVTKLFQVYSLLQRRRLGGKLRAPFAAWIDSTGTFIVFDEKQQEDMVVRLLELKSKLDSIWRHAFEGHQEIGHTLRESFEAFINKSKKTSATWNTDNSKPGEMIAKYVDRLLRAGAKAIPTNLSSNLSKSGLGKIVAPEEADEIEDSDVDEDSEVNKQLDQVLDLFRFVHGKAVFEAFYKKDLARRLLMGRSASNDAEKSMLERLKNECGHSFTQNLEQMFRDVELARDEMVAYKDRMEVTHRKGGVDLSVNTLSASAWPFYPDIPVIIPAEVKKAIDDFEAVYHVKHTGRKLQWKHALAHCQLRADFPKGKKELVVSSFQAIVLLLFNGISAEEHVTYERIKTESGLPEPEVKRTLQSLACAKLRPLTKHPKGREVDEKDTFTINSSFSHDKFRVKINSIQLKETKEENKETHERVAADRQYETQAAIVRIMKSRKTIGHAELIAETIKATKSRGTLQPGDIKKNIDRLIDKEYMEREEGNKYSYLA